jgi:hypothetical protein
MEQLSDRQVVQGCLELLQKYAGRGFNVTVPRPEVMVRYGICVFVVYLVLSFAQGCSMFCVWLKWFGELNYVLICPEIYRIMKLSRMR